MKSDIFLTGGARTPIGAFNGALAGVAATALGATAIKAALERAKVQPDQVDEVIMGNVLSAGLGQNPARQAAKGAGIPDFVGATTVNKVCGSGLKAVMLAVQSIQCGDAALIVAGGMESMSRAPYLLPQARGGYRMGHSQLIDSAIFDGLWDVYSNVHVGTCGDQCASKYNFTREQQDEFAIASNQRAIRARDEGITEREIVAVLASQGKTSMEVTEDEQLKRFNPDKLKQLKPAFGKDGTITAGNASSLNDGAAAIVVCSGNSAAKFDLEPVARVVDYSTASREPEWFTIAPIDAIRKLLEKTRLSVEDIDLFEINEAFSVVVMAAMMDLNIPHEKVNVHGGAVALGHPIGASGARTLVTLINAMQVRQAKRGLVTLCIGGGEAVAMIVELV